MNVKLSEAVKMFFNGSSLEMIYFEAIGNALDANATDINIEIDIKNVSKAKTLKINISDNGEGFTNKRFSKFSNLFDVEESSHKGLGRLVYLFYFEKTEIESFYDENKKRTFVFSEDFTGDCSKVEEVEKRNSGTVLKMTGYSLQKVAKSDYIISSKVKQRILEEFYSRLFQLKKDKKNIKITISSTIGGSKSTCCISDKDIPNLEFVELETGINLIDKLNLYFSIEQSNLDESSLTSAISVDNRTIKIDLIADENIPKQYKMVFLLFSDYFTGKVDATRQNLTIPPKDFKQIQVLFRQKVSELITERIPKVKRRNKEIKTNLINRYPHLSGYFDSEDIGFLRRNDILDSAQKEFFRAQKELLEADNLNDEQFEKSIEISARALTEYILFRQLTIDTLKNTTFSTSESELHSLFATTGKNGRFDKTNSITDLYRNNAWLLDDKYMTYETVLSDRDMSELISEITREELNEENNDRPDLALLFSNNPENHIPFDIVIVEFKKRGVSVYDNLKGIQQLEKRARNLMKYYNNQIQRIWYYCVIEFNNEVELALAGEYQELYSSGKMYHKVTPVAISLDPVIKIPINIFVWDLDAVVSDASNRNEAFLNLIKSSFIEKLD